MSDQDPRADDATPPPEQQPPLAERPSAEAQRAPEPARHHSRWWMVATAVFAVAAVGLGAWALSLRSDSEDKDTQIAAQQQQIEKQEGVAGQLRETASGIAENTQQALSDLGDQLDEIQGIAESTEQDAEAAIDEAESAAADAKERADSAGDEVDKAEAQAEEAGARADAAVACARGYLSAIGSAFGGDSLDAGIEQAKSEVEALNGSCAGTLGS